MRQPIRIYPYLDEADLQAKIAFKFRSVTEECPLHGHDCYEMEFVLSGKGSQYINGVEVVLQPGTLYLLTPSDIHRVQPEEVITLVCIKFMPELTASLGLPQISEALAAQLPEDTYALFAKLTRTVLAGQPSLPGMSGAALLMIDHLLRNGIRYHAAPWSKYIPTALQYIHQHYANPDLRLQHAADACGLSACHFSKLFHATVGISFSQYLADFRLRRACALLAEHDTAVTDVAFNVGFSCLPHFFRTFRKAFGCTPGEFQHRALAAQQG